MNKPCQGCGLLEKDGYKILGYYPCGHIICGNCAELHDIDLCVGEFRGTPDLEKPLIMKGDRPYKYGVRILPHAGLVIRVEVDKISENGEVNRESTFYVAGDNQATLRNHILPNEYNIRPGMHDAWRFVPTWHNN